MGRTKGDPVLEKKDFPMMVAAAATTKADEAGMSCLLHVTAIICEKINFDNLVFRSSGFMGLNKGGVLLGWVLRLIFLISTDEELF